MQKSILISGILKLALLNSPVANADEGIARKAGVLKEPTPEKKSLEVVIPMKAQFLPSNQEGIALKSRNSPADLLNDLRRIFQELEKSRPPSGDPLELRLGKHTQSYGISDSQTDAELAQFHLTLTDLVNLNRFFGITWEIRGSMVFLSHSDASRKIARAHGQELQESGSIHVENVLTIRVPN